jgi:hypothetical protein
MNKRVFRPLNTYGLIAIGAVVSFVITYTILDLSRACSAL